MAFFPCDIGPHPNPRRNINLYAGLADEVGVVRKSVRVCERHWGEIEPNLADFEVTAEEGAAGNFLMNTTCPSCRKPLHERGIQVFVTCYPAKDHRKDYWFQIHVGCRVPSWFPDRVNAGA